MQENKYVISIEVTDKTYGKFLNAVMSKLLLYCGDNNLAPDKMFHFIDTTMAFTTDLIALVTPLMSEKLTNEFIETMTKTFKSEAIKASKRTKRDFKSC